MKQNEQTRRFLQIYSPIVAKSGLKAGTDFCTNVLKINPATWSLTKRGKKNLPDENIYNFIKYFKLEESLIFGNTTKSNSNVNGTEVAMLKDRIVYLERENDLLKEIILLLRKNT